MLDPIPQTVVLLDRELTAIAMAVRLRKQSGRLLCPCSSWVTAVAEYYSDVLFASLRNGAAIWLYDDKQPGSYVQLEMRDHLRLLDASTWTAICRDKWNAGEYSGTTSSNQASLSDSHQANRCAWIQSSTPNVHRAI